MKFDRVMDFALENDRAQLGGAQQAAATAAASQYPIFMMAMVFITAKEVSQQNNENRKSNKSISSVEYMPKTLFCLRVHQVSPS